MRSKDTISDKKKIEIGRRVFRRRQQIYSAYVLRLRAKYGVLRKNQGAKLNDFLDQKFEYPVVVEPVQPPAVPPLMSGVGDNDALRMQNVLLNRELKKTNERLTDAQNKCRLVTREWQKGDGSKGHKLQKRTQKNIRLCRKAPSTGKLRYNLSFDFPKKVHHPNRTCVCLGGGRGGRNVSVILYLVLTF